MKANLNELYALARDAREAKDRVGAETYYEAILSKDPNGWEAPFYLGYYKVANSSINDLGNNCQEYAFSFRNIFDLAKASCSDIDSFVMIAREIREKTEFLVNEIIKDAYHDYPNLATSDELNARVFCTFPMCLLLSLAFDLYFPDGEMAADATELRKRVIQNYADLTKELGIGAKVIASGQFDKGFGETVSQIKAFDPTYTLPDFGNSSSGSSSSSSSSSGCYVATCVYGSYDCPEVWTLRRFRDYSLAKSWYGRLFIKMYYAVSPTIVKWFGDMEWFKHIWRSRLDRFVQKLQKE